MIQFLSTTGYRTTVVEGVKANEEYYLKLFNGDFYENFLHLPAKNLTEVIINKKKIVVSKW